VWGRRRLIVVAGSVYSITQAEYKQMLEYAMANDGLFKLETIRYVGTAIDVTNFTAEQAKEHYYEFSSTVVCDVGASGHGCQNDEVCERGEEGRCSA